MRRTGGSSLGKPQREVCRTWTRNGSTNIGTGKRFVWVRVFFRCGTCVDQAQVNGAGSVEGLGEGWQEEEKGRGVEGMLSMMCWNVCGWSRRDGGEMSMMRVMNDMRAKVLDYCKPDVLALVETWLKDREEIVVDGYKWFGCNRHMYPT